MSIGTNLAGAEFGNGRDGKNGTNYIWPQKYQLDYYAAAGNEHVRVPFSWERMQKTLNGDLDPNELKLLTDTLSYAKTKGLDVVIDPHDYARREVNGTTYDVGTSQVPSSALADYWGKLATAVKGFDNVILGLQNEPHNQSATQWIAIANDSIAAIRAAGATQKILVPGTYWDGAHSWVSSDNDTVVGEGVKDPLKNYAFEVHQYLDGDSSGTSSNVANEDVGVNRLKAITAWAKAEGEELWLGEFGAPNTQVGLAALDKMVAYMDANADVWIGASYWAGGAWWGNYMFSIEPTDAKAKGAAATDRAQMDILQKYDLHSGPSNPPPPVDPPPTEPTDPPDEPEEPEQPPVDTGAPAQVDTTVLAAGSKAKIDLRGVTDEGITGNSMGTVFLGNGGKNVIDGAGGNDKIEGRGGADWLTGGSGNDTFIYKRAGDLTGDTITDFTSGQDKIDLFGLHKGQFVFKGSDPFAMGSPQVRFQAEAGNTKVLVDIDGNGQADQSLTLKGIIALKATDFTL